VSVSDGLIAALLFFVVQGAVLTMRALEGEALTGYDVLLAFLVAGAAVFAMMRFAFWRLKSAGIPRTFGSGWQRSVALGLVAGLACAGVALAYIRLAPLIPGFEKAPQTVLLGEDDAWLMAVLAVCAAPVFEEFIFRGLIFGGLRRSLGPGAATLASAAIFAIVHPPFSVIPVFVVGVATALVYGRTGLLIGPMVAHAAYNAVVVGYQFLP
jgi:membrane protease YdiL (CAAX protease family)